MSKLLRALAPTGWASQKKMEALTSGFSLLEGTLLRSKLPHRRFASDSRSFACLQRSPGADMEVAGPRRKAGRRARVRRARDAAYRRARTGAEPSDAEGMDQTRRAL